MSYVDGFLLAVPKKNLDAYKKMSETAGKVWMEYGAVDYRECVADDVDTGKFLFPKAVDAKDDEVVVFSYISYKSREHRDEVNAKVMADPRIQGMCNPDNPPFDFTRMAYGGFATIVDF